MELKNQNCRFLAVRGYLDNVLQFAHFIFFLSVFPFFSSFLKFKKSFLSSAVHQAPNQVLETKTESSVVKNLQYSRPK